MTIKSHFFRCPKVAGQLQRGPRSYIKTLQAGLTQDVGDEDFKRTHLGTTRHLAASSSIDLAGLNLLVLVQRSCVPITLDRLPQPLVDIHLASQDPLPKAAFSTSDKS